MKFEEQKKAFYEERENEDGFKIMNKVTKIINELGKRMLEMDGSELADIQAKLIGYKFYLSDYLAEMNIESERHKLELKENRAAMWDMVSEEIRAKDGKVKNKEQIENILTIELSQISHKQILYETFFNKYKLKISAITDIITAISQRIVDKRKELESSKF